MDLGERDPCDGCDGECGDVCPVLEAYAQNMPGLRGAAEREVIALRQQLRGAVDLVRELGSAWRRDDMDTAGAALARLEDAVGLREQGGS